MPKAVSRSALLLGLLLAGVTAACGAERGAAPQAEQARNHGHDHDDGHDHDHDAGTADHQHGHAHGDGHGHDEPEVLPEPPPLPEAARGPHGGLLVRLSRWDEPDFGFAEVHLEPFAARLSVWLVQSGSDSKPLQLPRATQVHLHFVDGDVAALRLALPDGGNDAASHFVLSPPPDQKILLHGAGTPPLLRLVVTAPDGETYVTDDFHVEPAPR